MEKKRTYSDRRKYMIDAVVKRRKKVKLMAVQHLGGKCSRCGYNKYPELLEFHHKNPEQKSFGIALRGHSRSWERVKNEIEKCNLFCANCHREIHVEQRLANQEQNSKLNF